jgi:hypothetical protein
MVQFEIFPYLAKVHVAGDGSASDEPPVRVLWRKLFLVEVLAAIVDVENAS